MEGVTVRWMENPLESVIVLSDDADKRLHSAIVADEAENWVESTYKGCLSALTDAHDGDCTSQPSTCMKCLAEDHLEINTIANISNNARRYVSDAFRHSKTLDGAIRWLETEEIKADWFGWGKHAARWQRERDEAVVWLKKYKNEHGF